MEDDLKEQGYRLIYLFTFVIIFCIVPLIFIVTRSDLNRKQLDTRCTNEQEISEVLPEAAANSPTRYNYKLKNGNSYTSTLKYVAGDKVCLY